MTKLAIGSWAFLFNQARPTTDFHELLHQVAHLGYEGVELASFAPHPNPDSHDTAEKRIRLKRMASDHGLEIPLLAPDFSAERLVSVDDPAGFVDTFTKHLAFAADLGVATIRVDTAEPSAALKQQQLDAARALDRVVRAFDRCAKLAAERGIRVAWEFDPGLALHEPDDVLDVIRQVREERANPNFGVLFNTAHAHVCAQGAFHDGGLELLRRLTGKINHVHLIDTDGTLDAYHSSTRYPLGAGKLDFQALAPALLAATGGGGWWGVDLRYWPDAWDAAGECRQFLHRLRRKFEAHPSIT